MIRRILFVTAMLIAGLCATHAQSLMSDEQVAGYIASEIAKGTSQTKIVTDLLKHNATPWPQSQKSTDNVKATNTRKP